MALGFHRSNRCNTPCFQVSSCHATVLTGVVDDVRIERIKPTSVAIPAADGDDIFIDGTTRHGDTGRRPRSVVLKASRDLVRQSWRNINMIELADGHMIEMVPIGPGVIGLVNSPITAGDHVSAIGFGNPQGVTVRVNPAAKRVIEGGAAIIRGVLANPHHIDLVLIRGIHP